MLSPASSSLPGLIRAARAAGARSWAMATLVTVEGSSYRRPGARMLVSSTGLRFGVLSGGCIEEEIASQAVKMMESGTGPRLLSFDTRLLYGCDGMIGVFIEPVGSPDTEGELLGTVAVALRDRRPIRLRTVYTGAAAGSSVSPEGDGNAGESGVWDETLRPPVRLVAFGSGPEIAPLRYFAGGVGWIFENYGHVDEIPEGFMPDPWTAAVVVHHHFGRDCMAMARLAPLGLPYLGLLGPKKRRQAIFDSLQDRPGFDPADFVRVFTPAGLDLGGESPEGIALSIVSEICAVMAGRAGGFLRDRGQPIHDRGRTGAVLA